jgi:hypothetical protein
MYLGEVRWGMDWTDLSQDIQAARCCECGNEPVNFSKINLPHVFSYLAS